MKFTSGYAKNSPASPWPPFINFERSSSRFCPNLVEHGHFQDTRTGRIYDITIKEGVDLKEFINLPDDVCVEEAQITLRGSITTPQG